MSLADELISAAPGAGAATGWNADVIVLLWGCVPDQVMRQSGCPVLAVHPGRT